MGKKTLFQSIYFPRLPSSLFEFQISTSYYNFKIHKELIMCFDVTFVLVVFILLEKYVLF